MKIVTDNVRARSQALGNLFRRQSFVIGHLENRALPRFEPSEHLFREARHFGQLSRERAAHAEFDRSLEIFPAVEVIGNKMALPVQCPVIRILQDPHFEHALARIEIRHGAIDVEKNRLNYFLGLAGIPNDAERHIEYKPVIPIEENGKGVVTAGRHMLNKLLIRELAEILRLLSARLREAHFVPLPTNHD